MYMAVVWNGIRLVSPKTLRYNSALVLLDEKNNHLPPDGIFISLIEALEYCPRKLG